LVTLAIRESVPVEDASDPTRMYYTAFEQVIGSPALVLAGIIHDADASSQKLLFYAQVSPEARG